ncbi:MAG: bifunctional adenosylcobinamide kinase/adenosylcobinamide-phosphate guanylyltransferase [Planctomycetes bacterium]|nr:bifunctional adenosylcobinamide kinase/adenosylcobinamide-phosphate guanylyltransferase [Planctomycetota bacterium]
MLAFVYGGSGSGKSAFAEGLFAKFSSGSPRIYIATMWPDGSDAQQRIARHRSARADKGFSTFECYTNLAGLDIEPGADVLLECLGTLVANEMFAPGGATDRSVDPYETVLHGIHTVRKKSQHLVVVANNIGGDGITYSAETERYRAVVARLNRCLAENADLAVETVCGIPLPLKPATAGAAKF